MENIISSAVDDISSGDTDRIRQGILHVDELLTKFAVGDASQPQTKLSDRAKIRHLFAQPDVSEFLDLQDNFMLNIVSRLIPCIKALEETGDNGHDISQLLVNALELISGLCLVHYRSRACFSQGDSMEVLVKLLDGPQSTAQVRTACVNALVAVMVHEVTAIRKFEQIGGLKIICQVFKRKDVSKDVKLRILEFLFFYLIPETQGITATSGKSRHMRPVDRKTTQEKQQILGKYLSNVKNLVRELQVGKPFGEIAVEW